MERITLHPITPEKRLIKKIVTVFENGGLVIYPTDTGYSIGCTVRSKKAITRLYHLKRAIKKYVMAIIVPDFSAITEFALVDNTAFRYMKGKLPGPYTFILPANNLGKKTLDVKRPEIGVRMPENLFFKALREQYNESILNTAARINEGDIFVDPDEIEEGFDGLVDLLVDMGKVPHNPTTVISLVHGHPELIRQGAGRFE